MVDHAVDPRELRGTLRRRVGVPYALKAITRESASSIAMFIVTAVEACRAVDLLFVNLEGLETRFTPDAQGHAAGFSRHLEEFRERRRVGGVPTMSCCAPGSVQALIPGRMRGYGSTEEVQRGVAGAGHADGVGGDR